MSDPGTQTTDPSAQIAPSNGTPGSSSYQASQAATPSWWNTIVTDVEDPVNHPIVFIVGGLVLAGVLFLGSSKPSKKKSGAPRASRSITIKD